MRIVREIMPNGMPFIVQAEIRMPDGVIHPEDIKLFPLLEKNTNKGWGNSLILEPLPVDNPKQQKQLAVRLCKILNSK